MMLVIESTKDSYRFSQRLTLFRGWEFWGSDQRSVHLTVMRTSSNSHRSVPAGRGLWVRVNLPIFKDEGCCNLLLMAMGCGHFLLIRLGQLTFAAIHLLLTAVIPRYLGSEFRQRCHPEWCFANAGWILWCHNYIWCPQQGTIFPQAGIGWECS